MKTKKSDKRKLIEKLDAVFSQYIRLKDATPNTGYVVCSTCGKMHHWTKIQNGHYVSRARMALRFCEDNCHPQCVSCNVMQHGNMLAYRRFMVRTYGEKFTDELELRGRIETKHWTEIELREVIKYYTALVGKLRKEKGL